MVKTLRDSTRKSIPVVTGDRFDESRAWLSAILENTPDLIWSVDSKTFSLLFWNSAFAEFVRVHYESEIYQGMLCKEILPPRLAERWNTLYERVLREGPFELTYVIDSGKRAYRMAFNLVKFEGAISAISVFARDITAAHKTEEAVLDAHRKMAESEAHLTSLFESTSDMIWSVDSKQFGLLTYNARFADYCKEGLGIQIAVGSMPKDIGPPARVELWESLYSRALKEGPYRIELETIVLHRTLDLHFTLLMNQSQIFGVAVFGRDITIQRRVQRDLEEQRLEIARTQRASTIGQLAASLTHQLGQPLTAILANARAATRILNTSQPPLDSIRDILEDIIKDNRRAAEVIGHLGTLLNAGKSEFIPVQLNDSVAKAIELLRSDAAIRKVTIEQQLTYNIPRVRADPVQLTQVLLNLMLNALEAMEDSPKDVKSLLVQTCLAEDGSVQGSVADNGPGIPLNNLERLFEPFFTTKRNGLGTGLAVSRAILLRHQGRLWAENNSDGGATFYFSLPAFTNTNTTIPDAPESASVMPAVSPTAMSR